MEDAEDDRPRKVFMAVIGVATLLVVPVAAHTSFPSPRRSAEELGDA
jgi:hypothetical protein